MYRKHTTITEDDQRSVLQQRILSDVSEAQDSRDWEGQNLNRPTIQTLQTSEQQRFDDSVDWKGGESLLLSPGSRPLKSSLGSASLSGQKQTVSIYRRIDSKPIENLDKEIDHMCQFLLENLKSGRLSDKTEQYTLTLDQFSVRITR